MTAVSSLLSIQKEIQVLQSQLDNVQAAVAAVDDDLLRIRNELANVARQKDMFDREVRDSIRSGEEFAQERVVLKETLDALHSSRDVLNQVFLLS